MERVNETRCFEGIQGVYAHDSHETECKMTFALFLPPQAQEGKVPLIWYLSGLTCTHQNVMDKGEYRRLAAELGLAIICPDTSPRGDDVPDEADNWQFGQGAGFYLDASEPLYAKNYRMYSYIIEELPKFLEHYFPLDMGRQSIFGHSMGGHGALIMALKNPNRYRSVSAFAPIVQPTTADWSKPAFQKYLGDNKALWRSYDATCLIEDGARFDEIYIDQGGADDFLDHGLRPWLLQQICNEKNIPLKLHMREGYDHSYFFISTFMNDHLRYHAKKLAL
nr:S-formylglutathione hydrolase [Bartonella tamiae]